MSEPAGRRPNVGTFMQIMKDQPIALALVVMNLVLLGYLFYAGSTALTQRQEMAAMIVKWQQDTDKIMSSCVSADVMAMVLQALSDRIKPEPK